MEMWNIEHNGQMCDKYWRTYHLAVWIRPVDIRHHVVRLGQCHIGDYVSTNSGRCDCVGRRSTSDCKSPLIACWKVFGDISHDGEGGSGRSGRQARGIWPSYMAYWISGEFVVELSGVYKPTIVYNSFAIPPAFPAASTIPSISWVPIYRYRQCQTSKIVDNLESTYHLHD